MQRIADLNSYREEWLSSVNEQSDESERVDLFAQKLFSQWIEIDEAPEDFYSLREYGLSFAYYHEGMPEEDNSSEEYIWFDGLSFY